MSTANKGALAGRPVRWALLAVYYTWMPAVYLAIYIPFIVPRLASWTKVPTAVLLAAFAPYIILCVAIGAFLSHRQLVAHAILAATALHLFEFIGGLLHAPGMAEGWSETDSGVFWLMLLPAKALILVILAEAGRAVRALGRSYTRTAS